MLHIHVLQKEPWPELPGNPCSTGQGPRGHHSQPGEGSHGKGSAKRNDVFVRALTANLWILIPHTPGNSSRADYPIPYHKMLHQSCLQHIVGLKLKVIRTAQANKNTELLLSWKPVCLGFFLQLSQHTQTLKNLNAVFTPDSFTSTSNLWIFTADTWAQREHFAVSKNSLFI